MIIAPWHYSWTVSDVERSVEFYINHLGFEVVHRQDQIGSYTEKLVGLEGAHLKAVLLKFGGIHAGPSGHVLELIEYVHPKGDQLDSTPCNVGAAHFAMLTDDIHGLYEAMSTAGVRFVNPPVAIEAGINKGGYTCYFKDPDDFTLEILQPPEWRLQAARDMIRYE